jgi:hypothetical protein
MPARAAPPVTVGAVGADDATALFDPEPHIPDIPDVSIIPEGVDRPEFGNVPDDMSVDNAVLPAIDAVAGIEDEADVPPPSKVAPDPNICDDEVPRVEHAVALPDIAMVPVGSDGSGLVPAELISVAPSGIRVGDTDEPDPLLSGEVTPIAGVGVTMALTCALAALQARSIGKAAAINQSFTGVLPYPNGRYWNLSTFRNGSLLLCTNELTARPCPED